MLTCYYNKFIKRERYKKMKLYQIFLLLLVFMLLIVLTPQGIVRDRKNDIYDINVNTHSAVVGGGYEPGRVYYHVTNLSLSWTVKRSTWNFKYSDDGKSLKPNGDWWEDKYNVYQSSWWYIITSSQAPADQTALNARLEIHERY